MKADFLLYLVEANILNVNTDYDNNTSVANFVAQLLSGITLSTYNNSVAKKFVKIITTEGIATSPVTELDANAPDWAINAFENGNLVYFNIDQFPNIKDKFNHMRDYLFAVNDDFENGDQNAKNNATREIESLIKTQTFDLMVKRSNDYFKNANADKADMSGLDYMFDGSPGFKWYFISTDRASKREGPILQNCIGRVYSPTLSPDSKLYVLKSEKGDTHAAIRIIGRHLQEVKGKNNKPPISLYMKSVIVFFKNYTDVEPSSIENCDDIKRAGYIYESETSTFTTITEKIKQMFSTNVQEVGTFLKKPIIKFSIKSNSEWSVLRTFFNQMFTEMGIYNITSEEIESIIYVPTTNLAVVCGPDGKLVAYSKSDMQFIIENKDNLDLNVKFLLHLYKNKLITDINAFSAKALRTHDAIVTFNDNDELEIQHLAQTAVKQAWSKTANIYELPVDTNTSRNILHMANVPFTPSKMFLRIPSHTGNAMPTKHYTIGAVDNKQHLHLFQFADDLNSKANNIEQFPFRFSGVFTATNSLHQSVYVEDDELQSPYQIQIETTAWINLINKHNLKIGNTLQMALGVQQTDNGYTKISISPKKELFGGVEFNNYHVANLSKTDLLGYLGNVQLSDKSTTNAFRNMQYILAHQLFKTSPIKNLTRDEELSSELNIQDDIEEKIQNAPNAIINQEPTNILAHDNVIILTNNNKILLVQTDMTNELSARSQEKHPFIVVTKTVKQLLANGYTITPSALRYISRNGTSYYSSRYFMDEETTITDSKIEHKTDIMADKDKKINNTLSYVKSMMINEKYTVEQLDENTAAGVKLFALKSVMPNLVFKMYDTKNETTRSYYILVTKNTITGIRHAQQESGNTLTKEFFPVFKTFLQNNNFDLKISGLSLTSKQIKILEYIKQYPNCSRSAALTSAGISVAGAAGSDAGGNFIDRPLRYLGLIQNTSTNSNRIKFVLTKEGEKILANAKEGTNLLTAVDSIPTLPCNIIEKHEAEQTATPKSKKRTIKESFLEWLKRET